MYPMLYLMLPKQALKYLQFYRNLVEPLIFSRVSMSIVHQETLAKKEVERICRVVLPVGALYQMGETKVFLKQEESTLLELERDRVLEKSVLVIQKHIRAWKIRRR